PLAPFALAALDLLDPESPEFTLDVISTFEAVLDDPRQVLSGQQRAAREEELAALKAEGVDYTERMNIIEAVTNPQPLAETHDNAFDIICESNPWATDLDSSPKT